MRSQGQFGANYSVNGHRTSGERRVDFNKGYSFLFERCFEENTLEEIEKIDWSHVTVKTLDANYPPCSLPEGYSYVVKDISQGGFRFWMMSLCSSNSPGLSAAMIIFHGVA